MTISQSVASMRETLLVFLGFVVLGQSEGFAGGFSYLHPRPTFFSDNARELFPSQRTTLNSDLNHCKPQPSRRSRTLRSSTDSDSASSVGTEEVSSAQKAASNEVSRRDLLIASAVALAASIPVSFLIDSVSSEKVPAPVEIQVLTNVDEDFLAKRGVRKWDIWESNSVPSNRFDYTYEKTESVYILDGEAIVTPKDGRKAVVLKPNVFASFPKGLSCVWEVKSPVRKFYKEYNAILGFE